MLLLKLFPKRAQVEITTRCNLDCKMCPRSRYGIKPMDMSLGAFKKILDKLSSVKEITISGWGEPLLHPDLEKVIDYCLEEGKKIKLTTNGLLINDANLKYLIKIDEITFSIDQLDDDKHLTLGHCQKIAIENIRKLAGQRIGKKLHIRIQSVYYRENKRDILEIIKMAKELGIDSVKVMRINPRYGPPGAFPNISRNELLEFYGEANKFAKALKMRVDFVNYAFFKGAARIIHKISMFFILPALKIYCTRVLNFIYVRVDGKVSPCGGIRDYIIGDLSKEDLGAIYKSEKVQDYRKNYLEICKGCSFMIDH